jgi:thiol-disulfide isomerase/thioredoxin
MLLSGLLLLATASIALTGAFKVKAGTPIDPGSLDDLGPAPELTNDVWINSDKPLRIADLRGKVILLEFWTFACYNCQNTFPFMLATYEKYKDNPNVVMIGIHFPEMSFERDIDNVRQAVKDDGIKYPVAIDNDGKAWYAYEMHAWPAFIIVDKAGHMRFRHIGEGAYDTMDAVIQSLLTVPTPSDVPTLAPTQDGF